MDIKEMFFRIEELKGFLKETDYITLKHIEGVLSEEEFQQACVKRENWRKEIRQLETQINNARS